MPPQGVLKPFNERQQLRLCWNRKTGQGTWMPC